MRGRAVRRFLVNIQPGRINHLCQHISVANIFAINKIRLIKGFAEMLNMLLRRNQHMMHRAAVRCAGDFVKIKTDATFQPGGGNTPIDRGCGAAKFIMQIGLPIHALGRHARVE